MLHYHLWTIGCQMNQAESRRIAGVFASAGYAHEPQLDSADLVVLNTCVVRQSAEDRILGTLGLLAGMKKERPRMKIAVTGCFTARDGNELRSRFPHVDLFFGSGEYGVLEDWLLQQRTPPIGTHLPDTSTCAGAAESTAGVSAYVPIIHGCNNFCTYCIVPYTRGREISRTPAEVEGEIRCLVAKGTREVVLLGQNVDSYGHDLPDRPDLADLLERLEPIEGLQRIRFLTNHPKDMTDKLISTMARLGKVCEHLDLALQSGDNDILRAMARGYAVDDFVRLVARIRDAMPRISIATDIIVGFPGETDEQFESTFSLLDQIRFDVVHVAAYSPRPETIAARKYSDSVPQQAKKDRLHRIEELQARIASEINATYVQGQYEVLVEGKKKGRWFGRTRTHKLVFFESNSDCLGHLVTVEITKTGPWALQGQVVYNSISEKGGFPYHG